MSNVNAMLRKAFYTLDRQYGDGPLSVYTFGGSTTDLETGAKSISKTVIVLKRVIVLPASVSREVIQSISQISANKQFVYGGTFDTRARTFILERPPCPDLKDDDWFVYKGHKYELKKIQELGDVGYVVTAVELLGDVPEQIFPVQAYDLLNLTSTSTGEV